MEKETETEKRQRKKIERDRQITYMIPLLKQISSASIAKKRREM